MIESGQAAAGLALSAAGLALMGLLEPLARSIVPGRHVFFARWGFSHVGLALGALLLTLGILGSVPALLSAPVLEGLYRTHLMLGVVALLVVRWSIALHPEGVRALGIVPDRNGRAALLALVTLFLLVPLVTGLGLLWPWVIEACGGTPETQDVLTGLAGLTGAELAQGFVLGVLVGPFLEELLFRGFLQPLLVQNLREHGGIAVTSLLFAALHGLDVFLPMFAFSAVLGVLMLWSRRLSAPFVAHALFNAVNLGLAVSLQEGPATP